MKSPAMNSPLPSMKKQRSASPSQAMPTSAFCRDHLGDDVAAVLFDERIGLVVGEGAVHLEAQPRRPARQAIEQMRRDQRRRCRCRRRARTLNGWIIAGSMNPITCSTYGAMMSPPSHRAARGRRRRQRAAEHHLLHLADARLAAEREGLAPHQLAAVVLLRVVRRGDLRAAVEAGARHGVVHHVGAGQAVVDHLQALRGRAVDERRRQRRRRQPHVARDGDPPRPEERAEGAAELQEHVLGESPRGRGPARRTP